MTLDAGESAIPFDEVLRAELDQIWLSRQVRLGDAIKEELHVDRQLVGLALSGGGVRSATFSLGVLQSLARFGLLRRLDYLSSTGGGSQIAGWLLRWIRACGYPEVENQLSGKDSSTIEASEVQGLRRAMAFPKGREISNSSIAALARMRNVALNVTSLAALMGAAILLTRLTLEGFSSISLNPILYGASAVIAAIFLGVLSLRTATPKSPPTQLRTLLMALILGVFSVVILSAGIGGILGSFVWGIISGLTIACFSLILGPPRPLSLKILLAHLAAAAAAAAGTLAGFLFLAIRLGYLRNIFYELPYSSAEPWVRYEFYTDISLALPLGSSKWWEHAPCRGCQSFFWI